MFALRVYTCKDRDRPGVGQCAVTARVSQQGERNGLGHSHLNLEKNTCFKNVSGRILDNDIWCFSEFYKKNEGKSLLFSSKRCKQTKKCSCLPIPPAKILPKNSAAETRLIGPLSRTLHSESKLEVHTRDPDS